ncbi:CASP-like protein 1C2 [Vitis vinifera]|uniref:CASP-like protein n=1 Tax=Vitis vinifera TaxID=29760 RepID=A0A438JK80_VITVI|nr:CASP-like protein 1C2 [Vitis vinifera]
MPHFLLIHSKLLILGFFLIPGCHERTTYFSVSVEAKYSHTPAFKYFVIANVIGSAYSFLLLFLPSHGSLWPLVIASDVVITMFLTSSISAALSIAYVGKKGNSYAGWLPICDQVPNYCNHVTGALAAASLGSDSVSQFFFSDPVKLEQSSKIFSSVIIMKDFNSLGVWCLVSIPT